LTLRRQRGFAALHTHVNPKQRADKRTKGRAPKAPVRSSSPEMRKHFR